MRRFIMSTAVFAFLALGCRNELPTRVEPGQSVELKGEIAAGAECPMLVTRSGRKFALGGDLGSFKVGDRVCVRGTIAEMSYCMAGEGTIAVAAIDAEDRCP